MAEARIRFRGFRERAERELRSVLSEKHKMEPEQIKPEKITMAEFASFGKAYWENFDECRAEDLCVWGFGERNRERAAKIGIVYERKLVDAVPKRLRKKVMDALKERRELLERVIRSCREGGKHDYARKHERYSDPETSHIVHLVPIMPDAQYLNHDKCLLPHTGNPLDSMRFLSMFVSALRRGVLINPLAKDDINRFIYLKKYETAPDDFDNCSVFGCGEVMVRFHINVARLLRSRNLFTDPEGLHVEQEYGKTFMVKGGIPVDSIDGWSFWPNDDKPPAYSKSP
jgi:hypothetical protein